MRRSAAATTAVAATANTAAATIANMAASSWRLLVGLLRTAAGRTSWFFTADYLYVRASFSEAVAYIEDVDDGI